MLKIDQYAGADAGMSAYAAVIATKRQEIVVARVVDGHQVFGCHALTWQFGMSIGGRETIFPGNKGLGNEKNLNILSDYTVVGVDLSKSQPTLKGKC